VEEPHGVTSQNAAFFIVTAVKPQIGHRNMVVGLNPGKAIGFF
jgi:hypothetical protein